METSSIRPGILILNGGIMDIWQFRKRYFPLRIPGILRMIGEGTRVNYLTGNHDEALRKYAGFTLSGLTIDNKLVLNIQGKKYWFFHGDVFDLTMKTSKWLARLGGRSYDLLIVLNSMVNKVLEKLGGKRCPFRKR